MPIVRCNGGARVNYSKEFETLNYHRDYGGRSRKLAAGRDRIACKILKELKASIPRGVQFFPILIMGKGFDVDVYTIFGGEER